MLIFDIPGEAKDEQIDDSIPNEIDPETVSDLSEDDEPEEIIDLGEDTFYLP